MCGIYGVLALRSADTPDRRVLARMGEAIVHRGPDDAGEFTDRALALGMRRLSIIDVAGGHQPIANEDSTVWVVCNGEIYNFRELREELAGQGHTFRTRSDTEVIVHLYEQHGDDFISLLDGMFCFALWDARRERLLIGRDALGIKPLYYLQEPRRIAFASEAKAILALGDVPADIDSAALNEYLALGYTPAPLSLFRGIRKLPPASLMVCEAGDVAIHRYWTLPAPDTARRSEADWVDAVRGRLEQAVVSQMVSDVPLGAFLSGGIDSSAVVAMMARNSNRPVKTYSIGFSGSSGSELYNELPYARRVAELFGTEHSEIIVEPDVARLLPELLWQMDEPMADTALITTYLVSQFARRDVTVILSGVGGDELFGGYFRYLGERYLARYQRLPGWLRRGVMLPLARRLPSDRHSRLLNLSRLAKGFVLSSEKDFIERYSAYVGMFDPLEAERLLARPGAPRAAALAAALGQSPDADALYRLLRADLATQLPDDLLMLTDKMSMAVSLECRVPLLDRQLVELGARMPSALKLRGGRLKYVLKRALQGILPEDILHRRKRGFGAPVGAWLKHELAGFMGQLLSRRSIESRGLFDWQAVQPLMRAHEASREDHTDHLVALMNLELWCRLYLDRRAPADLSDEIATWRAA